MELSPQVSRESSMLVLRTFSGRNLKYPVPFGASLPVRTRREMSRVQHSSRGVGTMNRVGLMRIGAMLAVLLILVGAFAALPYWSAKAQTNTIWGIVKDCSATPFPRGLGGVTVSLIDAQGVKDVATATTLADGSYSFTPTTGSYIGRAEGRPSSAPRPP